MSDFMELCREGVEAAPGAVHWVILVFGLLMMATCVVPMEDMAKRYIEHGDREDRRRFLRLNAIVFVYGLAWVPYAVLSNGVWSSGALGRGSPWVVVGLCLIASTFYTIKVLRRHPMYTGS